MKRLLLLLSIAFIACTPQKRLNRLAEKHPELFRADTIRTYDTLRIEGIKFDTIVKAGITPDTITIVKDNVIIRYFNDGKTVYLQGETKTVEKTRVITTYRKSPIITKETNVIPLWVWIAFAFSVIIILLLVIRR